MESPTTRLDRLMCGLPWTLRRGADEWMAEGLAPGNVPFIERGATPDEAIDAAVLRVGGPQEFERRLADSEGRIGRKVTDAELEGFLGRALTDEEREQLNGDFGPVE